MKFYYRENEWYAGQFMRKITCNYPLNKYTGIYMETVLNGLSKKLLAGLVRDVDNEFLNSKIKLPVDENGDIDFLRIEKYVKEVEREAITDIYNKYIEELKN